VLDGSAQCVYVADGEASNMKTLQIRSFTFYAAVMITLFTLTSVPGQDNKTAEPTPGPPKVIRKSGGVLQQSAIKRVEPVYPPRASAEGVSGPVLVEITTDEDGNVIKARALSGHMLLKEAALDAARGWTFVPTRLSGVPVKVIGTITFNFNLGRFDSVEKQIEYYKKKTKEDPQSPQTHMMLGQAYVKAKRNQEAIEVFNHAIILNPNLAEAHYQLGSAYLDQGKLNEAIATLKKVIGLNSNHAMAHHSLGAAYSRLGREEDAALEFKEALRQDPDNTETHFLLGHSYFSTGKYEEAIKELKQLPPIEPYTSNAHVWLGLSYFRLGDKEGAMREQKILELINKSAAAYLLKEIKK
jgi:TonB family protein